MFSKLERMIALRYLRSRRREGLISVIAGFSLVGITLGVATLIVVMAVMNGFRNEITDKILGFSSHITVSGYERGLKDYDALAQKISQHEHVVEVTPLIQGQVMISGRFDNAGVLVKALKLENLQKRDLIAKNITTGSLAGFDSESSIVIGTELAMKLGVGLGDTVTMISPTGHQTALGMVPRIKRFKIAALFNAGMFEYDSSVVYMPLSLAQLFFKYKDKVSQLEVKTVDPDLTPKITGELFQLIGMDYVIQDWQNTNASLFSALKVERTVMFLLLTLIVIIAAFNIVASLMMLVNDKAQDIAILRTMGASKGMVMRIFFICGASVGVVGTLLGFVIGTLFALNIETIRGWLESLTGVALFDPVIYFLSELPADIQSADVLKAVIVGIFFSFLATLYPVYKVSKKDPSEVLRYE